MKLPIEAIRLLTHLEKHGISAFVVGGAVRDIIMGKEPNDYDIAAECLPEDLCHAFEGFESYTTGLRFGTLNVLWEGRFTEITCCRREGSYSDLRRPDSVEFCKSITEDLARRDFTVNAMAMDKSGTVTDPFGGRDDIEKKIIRCVGDATARFREDALRIIRALRFASTLGFEIEESTALAIGQCRPLLSCVAGERIFTELSKLLLGDSALNVLLKYKDEICTVIPELSPCVGFDQHNSYHIYTVYDHIAHAVDCCPKDLHIRLAMLLHDIGKPPLFFIGEDGRGHFWGHPELSEEMAEGVLKRLRVDSELLRHVCFLIKHHDVRPAPTRKSLGKYLLKVGFKGARELLHVRKADILSQAPQYFYQLDDLEESARIIDRLESEGFCVSVHDLCVNGKDLMDLGLPQGKAVGKLLDELLSLVASEQIKNERDALLAAAKKRISSRRDS